MATDLVETHIDAELAIETVSRLEYRGGPLRLLTTAIAFAALVSSLMLLAAHPREMVMLGCAVVAVLSALLVVRNVRDNSYIDAPTVMKMLGLPKPRAALLEGNTLIIGAADAPRRTWLQVRLSERELRELKTLALPAARIV